MLTSQNIKNLSIALKATQLRRRILKSSTTVAIFNGYVSVRVDLSEQLYTVITVSM